jgi:hypothetical protein
MGTVAMTRTATLNIAAIALSPAARSVDSSSRKAVSFSSACTMKRFPLSRCASTIQIVRPLESTAETLPQVQLALLRLSAMICTSRAAEL